MLSKFKMTPRHSLLLILILLFTTHSRAQGRAPHGLAHEKLVAFSPSAYDFFHPNIQPSSPLRLAATVQSSLAYESKAENNKGGGKVGAGGIAAIIFGFVSVLLLAMGVYYVATTRQANLSQNNTVIPAAA